MKKKGFTLVELLAVIAILAVILLISVPRILDVLEDSKTNAFRNSVRNIFHAIEIYAASNSELDFLEPHLISELDLSNNDFVNGIFVIDGKKITVKHVGNNELSSPLVTSDILNTNFEVIKGNYGMGNLSSLLLKELDSPLQDSKCYQSSCYGYYNVESCAFHDGTDVVSDNNSQEIYSIADGVITNINRNNTQCIPDFETSYLCGSGCTGNFITIKHTLNINGVEEIIYSTYRHLASFASDLAVGKSVSKGEVIGIMGTTGCSTGIHLHLELNNENGEAYNSEELFLYHGCTMIKSCPTIRAYCQY